MGKKSKAEIEAFKKLVDESFSVTKEAITELEEKQKKYPNASDETKKQWSQDANKKIDDCFAKAQKEKKRRLKIKEILDKNEQSLWQRFKSWIKNIF